MTALATPGAAVDCERIADGFLGQPVNALTSLSLVAAGLAIVADSGPRREQGVYGALVTMVGIGSFLSHGPMPPWGEWAHDASLAWVLLFVLIVDLLLGWERGRLPLALSVVVGGVLIGLAPRGADPLQAVLAAAVVLLWVAGAGRASRLRRRSGWAALALLGAGAMIGNLSRTGWPWCRPDSLLQGHGAWHVLAALSLTVWTVARRHPVSQAVGSH